MAEAPAEPLRARCLCLGIETARNDRSQLRELGAYRPDLDRRERIAGKDAGLVARLDGLTEGAAFGLGHNVIAFDQPALALQRRPDPPAPIRPPRSRASTAACGWPIPARWCSPGPAASPRAPPSTPPWRHCSWGDVLSLRQDSFDRWELLDARGTVVGRMARGFQPPAGEIIAVRVAVVLVRHARPGEMERSDVCCLRWELVLPEIEYRPAGGGPR